LWKSSTAFPLPPMTASVASTGHPNWSSIPTSRSVAHLKVRTYRCPALGRSVVPMKIAIIGAGNVGRALGGAWRTDHDITYGVRSPDDAKYADLDAATATIAATVQRTDGVALCTSWQGTVHA